MLDAGAYCRSLILAQPGVAGPIGARCYERSLPESASLPAVVYDMSGGTGETEPGYQWRTFEVICWAATRDGAVALYGALSDALHADGADQQTAGGEVLSGIEEVGGGVPDMDPETEYHYVRTTIRFLMAT